MLTLGLKTVEFPVLDESWTSSTWSLAFDKKSLLAPASLPQRVTDWSTRNCSNCRRKTWDGV